jgi:phosphoribosylformylglycinamidine synthase
VLAYHDRSDGGLFATVVEMALAGRSGVTVQLDALGSDPLAALFSEELGMVLQLRAADVAAVLSEARAAGLSAVVVGEPTAEDYVRFRHGSRELFADTLEPLHKTWAETSHRRAARSGP